MEGVELILFDLDGTLIDTVELIYQSFVYATRTVLGRTYDRRRLLRNIGRPLLTQMSYFSRDRAAELVAAYNQFNQRHHDEMIKPYPDTAAVLAQLKSHRYPLGVVTSKARELARRGLDCAGLSKYIDRLIAMEDTEKHKPDPEPITTALAAFAVTPAAALFIGDSPFDMQAGRAAGTRTAAALWGPFPETELKAKQPDILLRSIKELPLLLG